MAHRKSRLNLLASCSIAALLVGACPPPLRAAPGGCIQVGSPGVTNPSSASVAGYCVTNTSFSGNITNAGTISPLGITLTNGTINGKITSSGVITGGISIDSASKIISTTYEAIKITGSSFTGGVSNNGAITAFTGVNVWRVSTFSGGINNSGTISGSTAGILERAPNDLNRFRIPKSAKI